MKCWCQAGMCLLLTGCSLLPSFPPVSPSSQCGWRFEVVRPPLVIGGPSVTAVTSASDQGMTHLGEVPAPVALLQSGAARQQVHGLGMSAQGLALPTLGLSRSLTAGVSSAARTSGSECTLDDLCRALERIERRLNESGSVHKPLPVGSAEKE